MKPYPTFSGWLKVFTFCREECLGRGAKRVVEAEKGREREREVEARHGHVGGVGAVWRGEQEDKRE